MVDMNELNNAKNKMKREISRYKQTLKNLRDFLTNTTFSQFCKIVYPDFKQDESTGYLKSKYSLFQQNFGFFLSELDEKRLAVSPRRFRKKVFPVLPRLRMTALQNVKMIRESAPNAATKMSISEMLSFKRQRITGTAVAMNAVADGMKSINSTKRKSKKDNEHKKWFCSSACAFRKFIPTSGASFSCPNKPGKEKKDMELKDVCGIAEHTGIRIVVSYSGNGKFALGLSDGSTTPIVANGTPEEIEVLLAEQLPGYREKAIREATEKKAKEEEFKKKAAETAALAELKRQESEKRAAEKKAAEVNKQNQLEFSLI
mgnify:FL=1